MERLSTYKVVELMDGDIPRYTAMCRVTESFAALAWRHRHVVENPLMRWLRTLDEPPTEKVLLGSNVPLKRSEAVGLLRFRRKEVAKMCGTWPEPPDFALWQTHRGGRGRGRAVCRVQGEMVERWPSVEAAAEALKTSRDDIEKRIEEAHSDRGGGIWWESAEIDKA